jgi:hypothetical protein
MFPTSSMIEKEAPSKKQIPESEENSMRKNSVFVTSKVYRNNNKKDK